MSKRRFTSEQITKLCHNQNVERCSEKSITYAKAFKVQAVQHYEAGKSSSEIFKDAGFDPQVIGMDTPKNCLSAWRRICQEKGLERLAKETRGRTGGRAKTTGLSEKDRLERLEVTVAYLKAENDFLRQLRAKRAE